ncbi:MAG: substrate-binding domain-containing protein [Pseudomonadota bacterium]
MSLKPQRSQTDKTPSAADVAAKAGVSRSAVSRTFTEGTSVSAETRAKVLKAAEELNYHVNHLARGLSKEESRPVCILVSTLRKPYHARLLEELTSELQNQGRVVILINVGDAPENASKALEQTLNYRASVTIVLSGAPPSEMVKKCVDAGQSVILVNRSDDYPGARHIRIDYETAMQQAAAMFARAGCNDVAIVTRARATTSLRQREDALVRALSRQSIQTEIWSGDSTTYESGLTAGKALLSGIRPPQGVFCTTDLMACGFIDAAKIEFGLDVPKDVCVIGFDDIPEAGWLNYNLTTFAQPYQEIAQQVLDVLSDPTRDLRPGALPAIAMWRGSVRAGKEKL